MRKVLFVLGIVVLIAGLSITIFSIFVTRPNPLFLYPSFIPCGILLNSSRSGEIPPAGSITIMDGVRLHDNSDLHIEVNITGGTSNDALLIIMNSTHTDTYPVSSNIILDLHIMGGDTYYVFLNNSDNIFERSYSYKIIFSLSSPLNPYFLALYLVVKEKPAEAEYLYFIGIISIGIIAPTILRASIVKREEILLEVDKALPKLIFDGKDKVFYVCQRCGKEYPCSEKVTRSILELRKEAFEIAKERKKLKVKAKVTPSGLEFQQRAEFNVRLGEDSGEKMKSMMLKIADDIQQEASKDLRLCPTCQQWICKVSCWNRNKKMCLTCASQEKEEKKEIMEEKHVVKAKNFCPYCGTKITDPTQTKCSKCEGALNF